MKIKNAIEKYLEWKVETSETAGYSYSSFIRSFGEYFSGKSLDQISVTDVANFVRVFSKSRSNRSTRYLATILKDFYKFYNNIINPHLIRVPRLKFDEARVMTVEEFNTIDDLLDENNYHELRAKLIHNLLWSTGIRLNELCRIQLGQINLIQRMMTILSEKSYKKAYIMWSEKTHKLLIRYLGVRIVENNSPLLLGISSRQVERIVKWISERAGIQGIHPHSYRHGKAHYMINNGATIDEVAFVLRHENPILTKRMYLRLNEQEMGKIMNKYI